MDSLLYILGKVISIVNNGKSKLHTGFSSSDSRVMEICGIRNGWHRRIRTIRR